MLSAAKALIRIENIDVADEPDAIVGEFRARFHETRKFWDPFAKDKFASYLFKIHADPPNGVDEETAHRQIEEASLFIEAAHACYDRLQETPNA
jgi:sulfite reductase (ferredoxin)